MASDTDESQVASVGRSVGVRSVRPCNAAQRGSDHVNRLRTVSHRLVRDELSYSADVRRTEPACAAIANWAGERVGLHFILPGEPWRNGYIEPLNSRVRDECLNINFFWSVAQALVVITDWKGGYNHRRSHTALGYQAPAQYAASCLHR
jgi:hypothetical protein